LEVEIELKSPLGLEMRATQHVVGKIFSCVDAYLLDEFYAAAGYDVLLESCIEEVGL
jgi:hypothetical protein